jgi:RHS repeat-associated protein
VVEADGSASIWTYDQNSRLVGEARFDPSGTQTAQTSSTYDGVGNRLTQSSGGQTTNYSYNSLDQLTSTSGAQSAQYTYDGRGNLITATSGTGSTSYTYDAADRLTGATLPGGASVTYGYDAAGRQVSQTVGGSTTNSLWDEQSAYGDVVLETAGSSGAVQASYTLDGQGTLLAQTRGSTTSYVLPDGQGSVRALANSAGTLTDTYRYDAYGNLVSSQGTTTNPYRYDGQRLDAQTGLYQLRTRSYDPTTGRFVSRDTAGVNLSSPVELNRYSYAGDNPINLSDPSGHGTDLDEYVQITKQDTEQAQKGLRPVVVFVVIVLAIIIGVLLFAARDWPRKAPGATYDSDPCRPGMVIQLQQGHNTYATIPLCGYRRDGSGVVVKQAMSALIILRNDPAIPSDSTSQRNAQQGLEDALSWVQKQPPGGICTGNYSQPFYWFAQK